MTAFVIKSTVARTSIGTGNRCSGSAKFFLRKSRCHRLSAAVLVVCSGEKTSPDRQGEEHLPEKIVAHHRRSVRETVGVKIDHLHHFPCVAHFGEIQRDLQPSLSSRIEHCTKPIPHLQLVEPITDTTEIQCHAYERRKPQGKLPYRGSPDRSIPTIRFSSLRVLNMQASSTTPSASSGGIARATLRIRRTSIVKSASCMPRTTASR